MSVADLVASSESPLSSDVDLLVVVVGTFSEAEALSAWPGLEASLVATGFKGKAGTTMRVSLPEVTDKPILVAAAGKDVDADAVRTIVGQVVRTTTGFNTIGLVLTGETANYPEEAAEGAALGSYTFNSYKTGSPAERATSVVLFGEADAARAAVIGDAVALVKDLVTMPAQDMGPSELAEAAVEAVAGLPVTVTVYDENVLLEKGFGGILGVAQGSDRAPRLVHLDYNPAGAERHIALVGKGITFDTGGLSLKPAAAMVGMKDDMAGAATVLSVVQAAARLGGPNRVTAWMCITDNMPSGRAIRPGDVLTHFDGTTVEVLNTDAEGRLVLADGIAAASEEHPDVIIDVATLTGAILVALGMRHTGVFGDEEIVAEYLESAALEDELAWHMPLPEHMESELDSPIADMQNAKIGDSAGGASFAGLFLRRFVGKTSDADDAPRIPWAHLDIAGSAWHKGSPYGYTDKGATGASVRSLINLVTRNA
ncbi:leucyl aminopeptidase [Microbacterium mitrae]|uniref:Probable cytosol aminopeptidase n=1 Tax=Microbacterium mitrae TaxID=664640 RepID=A0A5C8HQ49_9MICO|nr:leucyl aminopeptidase [Microbacterium mitrae]TXK05452.1 leucyl aminopeptidase [Microbacterium mitrae]